MLFNNKKSIRIDIVIALTISVLVVAATLGIAVYAFYFVHSLVSTMALQDDLYNQLVVFQKNLLLLVIDFLIFGLIFAYYITKVITTPLVELVNGTKALADGNLKYRFKKSGHYLEVNELMNVYNLMAENLEVLYKDLENKVQARTVELEAANEELKSTQAMVVHSEKMRSLGQLVAGITHEINNPINFIYGNLIHLKNYSNALIDIIDLYESYEGELSEEKRKKLKDIKEKVELSFIKEDLPMLLNSCFEGTERTKNIIIDLKNFSRFDEMVINNINLVKEIDTTLNILHNKIKNKVDIVKEYEEDIPLIEGYGGQLNQVFMNILDNACYAIENQGTIYIRLQKTENSVIIEFEDTGCGIPQEQLSKIFEPFYTTKPVGEGTGLGMSISYKVIQRHNGTINVTSEQGKGTIFRIELPLKLTQK